MGGGIAQLASYGVADSYLTGQPSITFFKSIWRSYTNFSTEAVSQTFDGTADFGRKATVTLSRNGDLVSRVWLQITLPNLFAYDVTPAPAEGQSVDATAQAGVAASTSTGDLGAYGATKVWYKTSTANTFAWERAGKVYSNAQCTTEIVSWPYMVASGDIYVQPASLVRWCNSIGHALMSSVELEIGGQRIDKHFSEWWDIWSELSEKEEKRPGLWEMIGKYSDAAYDAGATRDQGRARTYYIPLTFCFNRHMGLALPLVALTYHQVKFNFEFRPYLECIRSTTPVAALSAKAGGGVPAFTDIQMYAEYVFLDTPERRRFATMPHEYLIEQLQFLGDESVLPGTLNRKLQLNFNHPVKMVSWVYVPKSNYEVNAVTGNQLFKYDITSDASLDVFDNAKLLLNGNDRFSERPPGYFRMVQPYQHNTRCPSKKVYVYSFALNPEDIQPSGTCNFSRVDTAQLALKMNSAIELGRVKVFALSYNILKVQSGLSGLQFAN